MTEYIGREEKCGDCIHVEVCERNTILTEFSRENPAYCKKFMKAADISPVRHGRWTETRTMDKIRDYLSDAEILAQLAEEASELAQAALKLRRVLDKTNPTPVAHEEAMSNLIEEYGDVVCCMRELDVMYDVSMLIKKKDRWIRRLSAKMDGGED